MKNLFMMRMSQPFAIVSTLAVLLTTACNKFPGIKPGGGIPGGKPVDVVYIESNNFATGANSVLAYVNTGDSVLKELPGSPFLTGGSGFNNTGQILGPNDVTNSILISPDRKYLYAVNAGSNTIAGFRIDKEGKLVTLPGSPYPSGGSDPISLYISRDKLFVVNKSQDPVNPSDLLPNYQTFNIKGNGALQIIPEAKFETGKGVSPSQALVSKNGRFLFGADFLSFMQPTDPGSLRSFSIQPNGSIKPVEGTPQVIPGGGGALGIIEHPAADVLYVGFPTQAKVGVYTVDQRSGELTFQSTFGAGPAVCWLQTNEQGDRLYLLNTGDNSVSIDNIENALTPTESQRIQLKNSTAAGSSVVVSQAFEERLSPTGKYLYVISQHASKDFTIGNFNFLHVLPVNKDGLIAEPYEPLAIPVPNTVRPIGIAVL